MCGEIGRLRAVTETALDAAAAANPNGADGCASGSRASRRRRSAVEGAPAALEGAAKGSATRSTAR